jgi:hypothetical protein
MKYGKTRGNKREVTIGTAHTVTVNSLIESNKQTNDKHLESGGRSAMDCETASSLCGNVLSGAILGPAPNKRLVAKKSSADGSRLAKSVAIRHLASVILDEYRSA